MRAWTGRPEDEDIDTWPCGALEVAGTLEGGEDETLTSGDEP